MIWLAILAFLINLIALCFRCYAAMQGQVFPTAEILCLTAICIFAGAVYLSLMRAFK